MTTPFAVYAKGEVSYYLDQQDQINEINDEKRRALLVGTTQHLLQPEVGLHRRRLTVILKGPDATATPLDVPEGVDPSKMIFSLTATEHELRTVV